MINIKRFKLKKDGTPYKYCFCGMPELIEGYDKAFADEAQTWDCHHRLETHTSDGERRLVDISRPELIALGMYYDRPPEELIFLKSAEHKSLHNKSEEWKRKISEANKGKHLSEETRRKLSEINKGENNPNYGKTMSEDQKIKISNSMRGHKGNSRTLANTRKVKKWGYHTPLYTSKFFASLDPNISYADFKKSVSESFCTWKKFQKYLKKS